MSDENVNNLNVERYERLTTPAELKARLPASAATESTVMRARRAVQDILDRRDPRLVVVVGPCSIHDPQAAIEYAKRLRKLAAEVEDTLLVVMRVYFEKPRTTVGWKGLINDPHLDGSFDLEHGLYLARSLLVELAELGLPAGTEALDPIVPQYISDLVTWSAIGARTTESQTHREMASGLSMPVGVKNGTDGNLDVAINALLSLSKPHSFLGIDQEGCTAIVRTRGNRYGHVVLRGGSQPNYDSVHVRLAETALADAGLRPNLMVDCSHANSNKDAALQPLVADNVAQQIVEGNTSLVGLMLESNLGWGNQKMTADLKALKHGVSITDACIDWATTERVLRDLRGRVKDTLHKRRIAA